MLIIGSWLTCDDGVTRPIVRISVQSGDGQSVSANFLVDCAADRTAIDATLAVKLRLPSQPPPPELTFQGVGGASPFLIVTTVLALNRHEGGVARIRGQFATLTDPQATDMSILGRDVLDHFDVIPSRRRDEVLLLTPPHQYQVTHP